MKKHEDDLYKWIKSVVEKPSFVETYNLRDMYPRRFKTAAERELKKLYDFDKKRRKELGEEEISEEEFLKSIHEYAKDWPEELRERAKPILDACPLPPEGPEM